VYAAPPVVRYAIDMRIRRMTQKHEITVYFDGACPLCRREIRFYQRRRGAEKINWVDIAGPQPDLAPCLTPCDARRRFHVRMRAGEVVSGARAFAKLWSVLPAFRPVGLMVQAPPFIWIAEGAYRLFLTVRPALQKILTRSAAR